MLGGKPVDVLILQACSTIALTKGSSKGTGTYPSCKRLNFKSVLSPARYPRLRENQVVLK
jgi:hypothetical protein